MLLFLKTKNNCAAGLPGDLFGMFGCVDKMPYNVLFGNMKGALWFNSDGPSVFHFVASEVH